MRKHLGCKIKIVLVYLGEIPEYVLANARYLSETFANHSIVLISDSKEQASRVDSLGFTSWVCSDVRNSWNKVSNFSAHKVGFRNDFWFKTVARFYALYEYQSLAPKTPLLHVEADVWLSPTFPVHLFEEIEGKIAYPLKNLTEGIASTLYVSDLGTLQVLIDYAEKCFQLNPLSTDVSILGSFHKAFPYLFENLPTLPLELDILRDPAVRELSESLNRNFEKYCGVFDSSSLGIHYTGVDPRNNWGFRGLSDTPGAPMELKKVRFVINDGVPFLKYSDNLTEVFSLHVHSKDIRMFRTKTYLRRLQKISSYDQGKKRNEYIGFDSLFISAKTFTIRILLRARQVYRALR